MISFKPPTTFHLTLHKFFKIRQQAASWPTLALGLAHRVGKLVRPVATGSQAALSVPARIFWAG